MIGSLITGGMILLAFLVVGIILSRLYTRASKEIAFVRTGLGGQKVVKDGGRIVLPVFHEIIKVNMNTLKLEVSRSGHDSLITKDRMRVDAVAAFFVRVMPTEEGISTAAQTLGQRTLEPSALMELVEDKFVDSLRSAAISMTMQELLDQRQSFIKAVQESVTEDLSKNGLELESVSLTRIDQTGKDFFNPDNAFDAEGLTMLTRATQLRAKERNEIEQDTAVQISRKNFEATQQQLTIDQEQTFAKLDQERKVREATATQNASVAAFEAEKKRESELASITAERQVKEAEVERDRSVKQRQIEAERELEVASVEKEKIAKLADQDRLIAVSEKTEAQAAAEAKANAAKAQAVKAEQEVITAEKVAEAERSKAVALVAAEEEAQRGAIEITVKAKAEQEAAEHQAAATRTLAEAAQVNYEVEAEGRRKITEANNVQSAEQIAQNIKLALIKALPEIIAASVKPMESIEGIKIVQVGGLTGSDASGGSGSGSGGSGGNLAEQAVGAALAYRAQRPVVDALLAEVGMTQGLGLDGLAGMLAGAPAAPAAPEKTCGSGGCGGCEGSGGCSGQ